MTIDNRFIAEKLKEVSDLLNQQSANPFRVNAWREASKTVAGLATPITEILDRGGKKELEDLPTIGVSIAAAVQELVETGGLALIDRLRAATDPELLFQTVPVIGPKLADRIHDELGIETLEALEVAAHNGQLDAMRGLGPRRVQAIQNSLAQILARRRPVKGARNVPEPPVDLILEVDAIYRDRAETGRLPLITPKRFNPSGNYRLPILHINRGEWHFTALFSNTALSHRLKRNRDWVVIYFERDDAPEGQCTVVTERRGALAGKRVIRGHEARSAAYYASP